MKELTRRQCEVMDCVCLGFTQVETSHMLHISRKTVVTHLGTIRRRLNASTTAQAAAIYAVKTYGRAVNAY